MQSQNSFAYITYLVNDLFLPGVMTLAESLKYHHAKYPLCCMVTPELSQEARNKLFLVGVHIIELSPKQLIYPNRKDFGGRYKDKAWMMFTKLNIFNQIQYKKLVYLDADTVTLDNVDELFEYPSLAAYSDEAVLDSSNKGLSAGVLVLTPEFLVFQDMLNRINELEYGPNTDQSFLNYYFPKFNKLDAKYNSLYKNMRRNNRLSDIDDSNKVKILHFNSQKPWLPRSHKLGWKYSKKDIGYRTFKKYESLWKEEDNISKKFTGFKKFLNNVKLNKKK